MLLLVGLFVVLRSETYPGLVLKFFVAKLVYSTSDAAALFLLGFACVALLFRHLKLPALLSRPAASLVWGGMLLGYGIHLMATIAYFRDHHIPVSAHVYHWSDGVNTYTGLLHSHLGKSAIALAIGAFSGNANYDTGSALAASVPSVQVWMIGVGFLASLAGALLWMPTFHARFGQRHGLTTAYLIAAATALKSIFDGGLLAYSVLPSLMIMGSFFISRDESDWLKVWLQRGWIAGIALLSTYLYIWFRLTGENSLPLLGAWLFFIVVLILLISASWRGIVAWSCRALMITYLLVNGVFDYSDNLSPLLRSIGPEHRAAKFDSSGRGVPQPLDRWIGIPVFQAYRELGDDPWKPRTLLLWEVPARGLNTFDASLLLLNWKGDHGQLTATPELRLSHVAATGSEWLDIGVSARENEKLSPIFLSGSGNALSKNNYYVWLYQVDLLLRNSGWRSYLLLPHTIGNI